MAAFDFPASPSVGDIYQPAGAQVMYRWDGTVWGVQPNGTIQPLSMKVTTFVPGSYSYIKPANLKFLQVELWGPGGGSGGAGATAASQSAAGGGGGGGAYVRKLYKASELSALEPLVVGAGGAAGTSAAAGGAGTNSTFKSLTAGGGGGGTNQVSTAVMGNTSSRGGAGAATGGDVNIDGLSGMPGVANFHALGQVQLGYGGAGAMGGSMYFPLRLVGTSQPNDATVVGIGANGGGGGASQPAVNGAKGGPGQAILTEYFTDGASSGGGGGASVSVGIAPPSSPAPGDLWWDSDSGLLYIYYNDGTSAQWVQATPNGPDLSAYLREEWGDWTPSLTFGGLNTGVTYTTQKGRWRKAGKMVKLWFEITLSNKGTAVGAAGLTNMPFLPASNLIYTGSVGYCSSMASNFNDLGCYVGGGVNLVYITWVSTNLTGMPGTNETAYTNTSRFIGEIEYETT